MKNKRYIKISWIHDFLEYPSQIFLETNISGDEIRRIEVFSDDKYSYASKDISFGTELSYEQFPDIDNFNQMNYEQDKKNDIVAYLIDEDEFNILWSKISAIVHKKQNGSHSYLANE